LKKSCPLSLAYQKQVHALDGFPADWVITVPRTVSGVGRVCRPTGLRPSSTFCEGHAIPVSSASPPFSPGSLRRSLTQTCLDHVVERSLLGVSHRFPSSFGCWDSMQKSDMGRVWTT
jgi:hypothetical protein